MRIALWTTTALAASLLPGIASAQTSSDPGKTPGTMPVASGTADPIAPAQSGPSTATQSSASAQEGQGGGLGDIVVTAQKRSESLQNVPIAIVAASGAQLAASGITNTTQLNVISPGLNIRVTAGSFQPTLRGVGTSSTVSENPVALYIDGVYIPQQRDGTRELEDIEQVAVLKGPQGTLFGRNATAGVIQITTRAPSFEFAGNVHAELDNYLTLRAGGYVTGGLGTNVAASLSGNFATQGNGWGKNLTTGNDTNQILHDFTVRGKVLIKLGPNTDVTIAGDYRDSRQYTTSSRPLPGTNFSFANPYTTSPPKSIYDTYSGTDPYNALKGGGVSLTLNTESNAVKLVSITAYRDVVSQYGINNGSVPQNYQVSNSPSSPSRSLSQELQVLSNSHGRFDWMFGLFYFNYRNGADPITRLFGGPLTPLPTSNVRTDTYATEVAESVAPFGEVKWEFLPDTHLTVGGRYTYESRELTDARVVATNGLGTVTTTNYSGRIDYSDPTVRLGLDHRFSDAVLVYASYNTGFKSGGFNSVSPATASYQPEKLKAYEAGVKSTMFDRRLRVNVSGFYYDYTNLQVIQFVNAVQTVINGPKAKIYGVDVDFAGQLSHDLRLSGGFEVLHPDFSSFPGAVFSRPNPAGGATLFSGDATGNRLPLAQKFTANLAVDYHHDLSAGSLDANITGSYNGDYYFQVDNLIRQGPYTIVNASITWTLPGDRVSLKVFGRNLADARIITNTSEQAIGYSTSYNAAPRTFGGGVGFKF